MRVKKIKKSFTNEKKEKITYYEFYIELENGFRIHIKPFVYEKDNKAVSTYSQLSQLAYEVE